MIVKIDAKKRKEKYMIALTQENLSSFIEYYNGLHDSHITKIIYDIQNSKIELFLDVYWSGTPKRSEAGILQTNPVKMKMNLNDVVQCNVQEMFSGYICDAPIQFVTRQKDKYLYFADDNENQSIEIVCKDIEYEEVKTF